MQYLRHKILFEKSKKPKLIVFSVDIFTLEKRKDLYNSEQFLPYMLWNTEIEESTSSYKGFDYLDYKIPMVRYYGKYSEIKKALYAFYKPESMQLKRERGYQGQNQEWNSDFDKAKLEMKSYKVSFDRQTIALFENFLDEMNREGVQVVLVYSPEYIEGKDFVENREQVISLYSNYSQQYNIPFYDFSNDSICYDKKLFYNASHLNKTGAELFSHKLVDTLKRYNDLN